MKAFRPCVGLIQTALYTTGPQHPYPHNLTHATRCFLSLLRGLAHDLSQGEAARASNAATRTPRVNALPQSSLPRATGTTAPQPYTLSEVNGTQKGPSRIMVKPDQVDTTPLSPHNPSPHWYFPPAVHPAYPIIHLSPWWADVKEPIRTLYPMRPPE